MLDPMTAQKTDLFRLASALNSLILSPPIWQSKKTVSPCSLAIFSKYRAAAQPQLFLLEYRIKTLATDDPSAALMKRILERSWNA